MKSLAPFPFTLLLFIFSSMVYASQLESLADTMLQADKTSISNNPDQKDLVSMTMDELGITQNQAQGGLGSLLSMAKSSLGDKSFSSIAESIPDINSLLQATPQLDNTSTLSTLNNTLGNQSPTAQGSLMVYNAFDKLGLSKGLVDPMMDILEDYLSSYGGKDTSDLLMKALTPLTVTQDPLDLR
ncbi:DUF2780 domain-containing protein [uncultured Shewanella sp.]|uniref:DUF2780 domain-containing protein n=1 Tax=uncultured Shewanella sp. TaxID=173975 RepID=UPI002629799E|nr:DUF2780 domain-containing protein [uncultured Shewanella sp.]